MIVEMWRLVGVFSRFGGYISRLDKVVRAKNDYLLDESNRLRSEDINADIKYTGETKLTDGLTGVAFTDSANTWLNKLVDMFKSNAFKSNRLLTRAVVYSNKRADELNRQIRARLFGINAPKYVVGDLLMGYNNERSTVYGSNSKFGDKKLKTRWQGDYLISNGLDYVVEAVSETKIRVMGVDVDVYKLTINDVQFPREHSFDIHVPKSDKLPDGLLKHYKDYYDLGNQLAKAFTNKHIATIELLKPLYDDTKNQLEKLTLPFSIIDTVNGKTVTLYEKAIDYGYAHTVHKSQGGTYQTIFVDDTDISRAGRYDGNRKWVSDYDTMTRLRYVAVSRAEHTAYILSNDTKDSNASQLAYAIGLSQASNHVAPIQEQAKVLQGEAVARVSKNDVPKTNAKQWAKDIFDGWNNKATHPVIGKIGLSHNAVNNTFNHGMMKFKLAVIPAIKEVLEKGVLIHQGEHTDKGNRFVDYFISAPVRVDDSDDIVTVLVKEDTQNKQMYIHSVTTKERLMTPKDGETVLAENANQQKTSSTVIHNILHKALTYKERVSSDLNHIPSNLLDKPMPLKALADWLYQSANANDYSMKLFNRMAGLMPSTQVHFVSDLNKVDKVLADRLVAGGYFDVEQDILYVYPNGTKWQSGLSELVNYGLVRAVTHGVISSKLTQSMQDKFKRIKDILNDSAIKRLDYALTKDYPHELVSVFTADTKVRLALRQQLPDVFNGLNTLVKDIIDIYENNNQYDWGNSQTNDVTGILKQNQEVDNQDIHENEVHTLDTLKIIVDGLQLERTHPAKIMFGYLFDSAKKFNPSLKFSMGQSQGLGHYDPFSNAIVIDKVRFDGVSDHAKLVLINHELWHGLTEHNLAKPSKAKDNLEKMRVQLDGVLNTISDNDLAKTYPIKDFKRVRDKLATALDNIPEMVAYGMTDPDVQKFIGTYLDLDKANIERNTTLKAVLDSFLQAVYSLLGLQKKLPFKTFVANASSLVHEIDFNQSGEIRQSTHPLVDRIKQAKAVLVGSVPFDINPKSALAWAKEHIRGEYVVQDTGEVISVTNVGLKKTLSHDWHEQAHIKSVSAIPEMLKNAVFITETKAEKDKSTFDTYRYYVVGLKIDGVDYTARLTIGVDSHGNKFYDHRLTQIEKTKLIDLIDQSAKGFKTMGDEPLHLRAKIDDNKLVGIVQEALQGKDINNFKEVSRKANSIEQARNFANLFKGKELINRTIGLKAKVSRNSLDKMLSASAMKKSISNTVHLTAVANIDTLFENAIKGWDKPDRAGDTDISRISRFFAPMVVDGQAYLVKLTIKEFVNDQNGNRVYSVESLDVGQKESLVAEMVAADFNSDTDELTSNRPHKAVDSLLQQIADFNGRPQIRYSRHTLEESVVDVFKSINKGVISDTHNQHLDRLIDKVFGDFYTHYADRAKYTQPTPYTIKP